MATPDPGRQIMYISSPRDFRNEVERYFGNKAKYLATTSSEGDPSRGYVGFLLYETLIFRFIIGDPPYNALGISRLIGGSQSVSKFALGDLTLLDNDEEAVLSAFEVVDRYSRLLLPDKFLELFDS
jgi:hypothetical protein